MNWKRKTVIRNKIKRVLIPAAVRNKRAQARVHASVIAQMKDIGVLVDGLFDADRADALEREYAAICDRYTGIEVHFLFNLALGAFVQTFLIAEKNGARGDGKLHMMVPAQMDVHEGTMRLPNPVVPQYFDYLFLPRPDKIQLYLYILNRHLEDADLSAWSKFAPGSIEADGSKDAYADYRNYAAIHYSEEELAEGMAHLQKLGVHGKYVSFRNRVAKGGSLGGVRNGDTQTYYKAVSCLQEQGIQCVYVGLNENEQELGKGIIDASKQYDAKMDLFIHSQAQFFMGDHSGIIAFAQLFNRPLILLNLPYFTMDGDAYGPTFYERDILLPEKIYDTKKQRYLTIREMLHYEMEYLEYQDLVQFYVDNGYEFHKNTADEILSVVKEMQERIAGSWQYSEEDLRLQKKYLAIMNENARKYEAKWCRAAIGMEFLRNNQWLLG